jgi:hypothetical protein
MGITIQTHPAVYSNFKHKGVVVVEGVENINQVKYRQVTVKRRKEQPAWKAELFPLMVSSYCLLIPIKDYA